MTQDPNTSVWILSAVVSVLGAGMWWSIRTWIKGVNEEISKMRDELRTVGNKNVGFEKDINKLDREHESHDKRMHDYSERIRELEQKQASCRNCNNQ
jgi:chromosome segregation ATPase